MPVHDWAKANPGLFHHFHQQWTVAICNALNAGVLPEPYYALVETKAVGVEPDVLTLARDPRAGGETTRPSSPGGIAVAVEPPRARFVASQSDAEAYARRANRVAVRGPGGEVVAIVELVSPGNKDARNALKTFVQKLVDFLGRGVHVLVIDLFPPTPRDPNGVHALVWEQIADAPFALPPDKPLTLASYAARPVVTAYVEPVAAGDTLPDMPLFLDADTYVRVPLEATYRGAWEVCPRAFKEQVTTGAR